MKLREYYSQHDYSDLCSWWTQQGWPEVSSDVLSKYGFIAEQDGQKIACTFIFPMPSKLFLMEWTVANPNVDWKLRDKGIQMVTNQACFWAKENGASSVFTMTKHKRFAEKLENLGFIKTDENMIHFVRSL